MKSLPHDFYLQPKEQQVTRPEAQIKEPIQTTVHLYLSSSNDLKIDITPPVIPGEPYGVELIMNIKPVDLSDVQVLSDDLMKTLSDHGAALTTHAIKDIIDYIERVVQREQAIRLLIERAM